MGKLCSIALQEYRRNTFRRSFLLTLLSLPGLLIFMVGIGMVMESRGTSRFPVGYVDHADLLAIPAASAAIGSGAATRFISFPSEEEAGAALAARDILAYWVVSADYRRTRHVHLYYVRPLGKNDMRQFYDWVRINLLAGRPDEMTRRALLVADSVTVTSMDGRRQVPNTGPTFGILMPLFIGFAFLYLLLSSSGYLLQALVEEKENRTMEVVVTSVSPLQLVGGKVAGIVGVSFTQITVWTVASLMAVLAARQAGVGWMQDVSLDWGAVLATSALAAPSYVLACALSVALGAAVGSTQDSQPASAVLVVLHGLPLVLSWAILSGPHSPLAATLTFLPFTGLLTVVLRNLFASVPAWQVGCSIAVQSLCALAAIWFASRVVRLGMLRCGRPFKPRELLRVGAR